MSDVVMFFFFNDTATTEIYTLSLHDALPIFVRAEADVTVRPEDLGRTELRLELGKQRLQRTAHRLVVRRTLGGEDRKSTRLNSSHANISYAVFCLKKKNKH